MERLRSSWYWFVIGGVIAIIGGILALVYPVVGSVVVVFWAAWAFLLAGIVQVIQSFQIKEWGGFLWLLLVGLLGVVTGGLLLYNPLAGSVSLTMLFAAVFLAYGIIKIILAFRLRPEDGWGWVLASGALSVLLALMIFANFPWAALSVLGIFLGIELLSYGVSLTMLGFALKRRA